MAYTDSKRAQNRKAIIVATISIEALAILAVVKGLDVPFLPRPENPPLVGEQIPLDPPPLPPDPKPLPKAKPPIVADYPIPRSLDLDIPSIPLAPVPMPLPAPTGGTAPLPTASPPADPLPLAPAKAVPLGNPRSWVSTNDYPARDLREGNQGTTGFELTVGTNGRVIACRITRSSGFPGLDNATCEALTRRARFTPAKDGTGAGVPGRYTSNIIWVIPD